MNGKNCADLLELVRNRKPLVHHITNYVTVNDCANITICIGAAPVMAEAETEVEEMVSVAGALVLNIGTLSAGQVESMLIAGRKANKLGIPVILDPVGAGATRLRTDSAWRILDEVDISVIKGNAGEIGVLSGTGGSVRGVDSGGLSGDPVEAARECAGSTGSVVAISGETDIITDGKRVFLVQNGNPMMGRLSGTGCMASSVTGAFAAVSDDRTFAAAAALSAFGRAGERAAASAKGPYSFRTAFFDELASLTPDDLRANSKIELL